MLSELEVKKLLEQLQRDLETYLDVGGTATLRLMQIRIRHALLSQKEKDNQKQKIEAMKNKLKEKRNV